MLDIENEFPGKSTPADANYPSGSARNVTAPGTGDGTPFIKRLVDDWLGAQQALILETGQTVTGDPDTALDSQFLDAIKTISARSISKSGTSVLQVGFLNVLTDSTTFTLPVIAGTPPLKPVKIGDLVFVSKPPQFEGNAPSVEVDNTGTETMVGLNGDTDTVFDMDSVGIMNFEYIGANQWRINV